MLDALEGMGGQESGATGAYTQAELGGPPTYVSLPKNRWPKSWRGKYDHPVVPLRLSLYGHPLAGLYWEQGAAKKTRSCGFVKMQAWECLYHHPKKQFFLSIYVDDFKLCGAKHHIAPM